MKNLQIKKKEAVFSVPTAFVDRYMPSADELAVKVYLYLLCHLNDANLTVENTAVSLGVTDEKVIKALKYWHEQSVITFEDADGMCSVEFTALDSYSTAAQVQDVPAEENKSFAEPPKYLVKDINAALKTDKNVRDMFVIAEQLLCKPLNHNDMKIMYSFYDWLKLPIDVIVMLLEHCTSIKKMDLRYIEKVAITWADNGIDNFEKANIYIKGQAKLARAEKKVKRIMQISGRDLTERETEFVRTWLQEYKATEANIKEAYEITVMNTGKMNFKYMDAVLKNLGKEPSEKKNGQKKNTKFNNFTGDDNLSDFEKKMFARRMGIPEQ